MVFARLSSAFLTRYWVLHLPDISYLTNEPLIQRCKDLDRKIVYDNNFIIRPGRMLMVIGPSAARRKVKKNSEA